MPPTDLSLIERYGSFGLLCLLVLGFAFYVVPLAIRKLTDVVDKFDLALTAERKAREEQNAHFVGVLTTIQSEIARLSERVEDCTTCANFQPAPTRAKRVSQ